MEYIASCIWGVQDIVFFLMFLSAFFVAKRKMSSLVYIAIIVSVAYFVLILLDVSLASLQIISLAVVFIAAKYLFQGPWYQIFLLLVLGFIVNSFLSTIVCYSVSILMDISFSELVWKKLLYIATATLGKILSLLAAWIARKVRKPKKDQYYERRWMMLMVLFSLVSFAMILYVFYASRDSSDLPIESLLICIMITIADFAMLYLINAMEKSALAAQQLALLHQQMDIQTNSILALERSYRSQRQLTHDFKSQLQAIHGLLTDGNMTAAKEYISKLQEVQTTRILAANSRHAVLDSVLNMKYQYAREHEIDFHININDLSSISLDTNTIVVLLSNLLDNAIEACCRISGNRGIYCDIILKDHLFVSIRNTSAPVQIKDNRIATSKEPKEEHGFGLLQIQYLLNQLNSEYCFEYENGWFTFVAEIPQ